MGSFPIYDGNSTDEEEEDVDGLGLLVLAQQEDHLVLGL
jgi:hypothetical protein